MPANSKMESTFSHGPNGCGASPKKRGDTYLACTPVVTPWPLSVFTVVEQPPTVVKRMIAPKIENKMVRIDFSLLVSLFIRKPPDS
jgi:hypothetical protein